MALISVHMLQNHAPSNLNRDENGDPKDAMFGSVRRARISSQASKRAIRHSETFENYFTGRDVLAQRGKLKEHIEQYLEASGQLAELTEEQTKLLFEEVAKVGKKDDDPKKPKQSSQNKDTPADDKAQMMLLTKRDVEIVATRMLEHVRNSAQKLPDYAKLDQDEKGHKGSKGQSKWGEFYPHSVDIAMFGRMTTSSPFMDVEAAVEVAHAISTHKVDQEFDFFTAFNDVEGQTDHLGETAFNSATYYKYINVHWDGLVNNLGGDAKLALVGVKALIHAALIVNPSGKQKAFASHVRPSWVLIEIRDSNVPISYVNAFAKPIRKPVGEHNEWSLIEASALALEQHILRTDSVYDLLPEPQRLLMRELSSPSVLGIPDISMKNLLAWFDKAMLQQES